MLQIYVLEFSKVNRMPWSPSCCNTTPYLKRRESVTAIFKQGLCESESCKLRIISIKPNRVSVIICGTYNTTTVGSRLTVSASNRLCKTDYCGVQSTLTEAVTSFSSFWPYNYPIFDFLIDFNNRWLLN